jgi:hypothetical protein
MCNKVIQKRNHKFQFEDWCGCKANYLSNKRFKLLLGTCWLDVFIAEAGTDDWIVLELNIRNGNY